jgi:hypothetical protein
MFVALTRKQSILLRCLHFSASSAINIPATRRTGQQDWLGHHDQHGGLGRPLRTGWSVRTSRKYPSAPPDMTASRKPGARHIASNRRSPSACISVYPVEFTLKPSSCELAPHTVGGCQAPQTPAALPRSPSRTAPRSLFHRETRRRRDVALLRHRSRATHRRLVYSETRCQGDAPPLRRNSHTTRRYLFCGETRRWRDAAPLLPSHARRRHLFHSETRRRRDAAGCYTGRACVGGPPRKAASDHRGPVTASAWRSPSG